MLKLFCMSSVEVKIEKAEASVKMRSADEKEDIRVIKASVEAVALRQGQNTLKFDYDCVR